MENPQNVDGLPTHAIGHDIWGLIYHQLARARYAAWASHRGKVTEELHRLLNPLHGDSGSLGVVLCNIGSFLIEVR